MKVASTQALGSKIYFGQNSELSVGTDTAGNFEVHQASGTTPVLQLDSQNTLHLSAQRVEASILDVAGGISVNGVRLTFAGCAGALAFMTAISVAIGQIFHAVPTSLTRGLPIDDYVAIASFLYFGVKSLLDALNVETVGEGIAEERADAEDTLESVDVTGGWPLVVEACTLTIAAEVGDRSQLATIALSAAANPLGVFLGGTAGHCLATGMAVLGGSFISKFLSERVIGIIGGVLFLGFAASTAIGLF